MTEKEDFEVVEGEPCPFCHTNNLTLMERVIDVPYFGVTHVFSMDCQNCDYHMSDIEAEEERKPVKLSFEIATEEDLKVRVVKSASATVKIPRIVEITPGPQSNGYITNIEGILNRVKNILQEQAEDDDKEVQKKAKNHLKKLQRVLWGRETLTISITDPTGNSAIISDKVQMK